MSSLSAQMKRRDTEMVPLILIRGMFAVMAASLILVFAAALTDRPRIAVPPYSPVVAEMTILFEATREGNVTALDDSGAVLARSNEDRAGFLGVIWRVIARERLVNGLPDDAPVRVVRRENGNYAVIDTATDWSVELIGYGKDNVAAFANLLDPA